MRLEVNGARASGWDLILVKRLVWWFQVLHCILMCNVWQHWMMETIMRQLAWRCRWLKLHSTRPHLLADTTSWRVVYGHKELRDYFIPLANKFVGLVITIQRVPCADHTVYSCPSFYSSMVYPSCQWTRYCSTRFTPDAISLRIYLNFIIHQKQYPRDSIGLQRMD